MGTYPQIKFYRGAKADVEAQSPAKGSIWFNTANGSINIKGESAWESYSGYRDVSFALLFEIAAICVVFPPGAAVISNISVFSLGSIITGGNIEDKLCKYISPFS